MTRRLQLSYKQTFEQMYLQLKHHRKGRDVNIVPKTTRIVSERHDGTIHTLYPHDVFEPVPTLN